MEHTVINENHESEHLRNVLISAKHNQQVVFDQIHSLEGLPGIETEIMGVIKLINQELEKLG